jgi:hypothetical protein
VTAVGVMIQAHAGTYQVLPGTDAVSTDDKKLQTWVSIHVAFT